MRTFHFGQQRVNPDMIALRSIGFYSRDREKNAQDYMTEPNSPHAALRYTSVVRPSDIQIAFPSPGPPPASFIHSFVRLSVLSFG